MCAHWASRGLHPVQRHFFLLQLTTCDTFTMCSWITKKYPGCPSSLGCPGCDSLLKMQPAVCWQEVAAITVLSVASGEWYTCFFAVSMLVGLLDDSRYRCTQCAHTDYWWQCGCIADSWVWWATRSALADNASSIGLDLSRPLINTVSGNYWRRWNCKLPNCWYFLYLVAAVQQPNCSVTYICHCSPSLSLFLFLFAIILQALTHSLALPYRTPFLCKNATCSTAIIIVIKLLMQGQQLQGLLLPICSVALVSLCWMLRLCWQVTVVGFPR